MPFDVKMPQLGMAQDSGVIVAWLKAAGDRVSAGEVLFEVETDKATMEVEAAADGFLAGIRAGEGDDVPVGNVIAVIVESESQVADHAGAVQQTTTTPESTEDSQPAAVEQPAPDPDPAPSPAAMPTRPAGKVLASPMAKRLAAESGIDLAALRAQGVPEPIHAGDLRRAAAGGHSSVSARCDSSSVDALLVRGGEDADRTMLFAAFAAGAWRALFDAADVVVSIRRLDGATQSVPDPDRGGTGPNSAPALSLVDLCDTRLTAYSPAGGGTTLCIARDGTGFALTLAFSEATLPLPQAAALLNDIAARVEDPIRQLL